MKTMLVDTAGTLKKGLREQGHEVPPIALAGHGVPCVPGRKRLELAA